MSKKRPKTGSSPRNICASSYQFNSAYKLGNLVSSASPKHCRGRQFRQDVNPVAGLTTLATASILDSRLRGNDKPGQASRRFFVSATVVVEKTDMPIFRYPPNFRKPP
jgi:hypothetical protein